MHTRHYYSVCLSRCSIVHSPIYRHKVRVNHDRSALGRLWEEDGQDVAEYAVMLAVILAVVVGTIRMIGSGANNVFSSVSSAIQ